MSIQDLVNSRTRAIAVVVLAWAVIYLPALGSIAIKGEEGRRILPAIRMLETGNYIVPQVGSNPYYRKPPLVNWLVAASFETFGVRNEWTARLPSVISVLAVAIAFAIVARASLTPKGSMLAALIWMTNIGILEKGRLIEIEALYVSLCGLAIIFWLSFFLQKKSPWLIWLPASVFLGLGLLAKGPTDLVFFYGIVVAVLAYSKHWRLLVHPAHFVALAVMLGIAAAWAIPFVHMTTSEVAMGKWFAQYTGRLKGIDFKFFSWIQNIPRGLIYFLPWLLLLIQHAVDRPSIVAAGDDMCRRRIAVAKTHCQEAHMDQCGGGFRRPGACDRCDWLPGHGNGPEEQTAGEKGRRRNQWARAHE
ncbi:MAG: hypothetical protein DMF00_04430 [Verrucomicrobia bacterium]|nr:MAG: hypothetical protein DMF00_04430 [Verrucomicrobiota bacterium]